MQTIDGTEVTSAYDPAYSQQQFEQQNVYTGQQAAMQTSSTIEEWTYAYDDNGYIYWYNNVTGHSQYEDPYSTTSIAH